VGRILLEKRYDAVNIAAHVGQAAMVPEPVFISQVDFIYTFQSPCQVVELEHGKADPVGKSSKGKHQHLAAGMEINSYRRSRVFYFGVKVHILRNQAEGGLCSWLPFISGLSGIFTEYRSYSRMIDYNK
jgi:hypothetical protein